MTTTTGNHTLFFTRVLIHPVKLFGIYVDDVLRSGRGSFLSTCLSTAICSLEAKEPIQQPLAFTGLLSPGDQKGKHASYQRNNSRRDFLTDDDTLNHIISF